jgi:cytochrome c peroxidase
MRSRNMVPGVAAILMAAAVSMAQAADDVPSPANVKDLIGHLGPVPVPKDNPLTAAQVDLGERLFEDPTLSGDGSVSCETCHLPDHGFATADPLGPAYPSKSERRNSPTLINVAYNHPLLWDGRAPTLEKQALGPIGNVLHMNNNIDLLVQQLEADGTYGEDFARAFGDPEITPQHIAYAIASFERTLVFDGAPLDAYMDGDESALDDQQKRGLALFFGKGNCVACHNGPNLTDNGFHNLGVPDDDVTGDPQILASIHFDAKRTGYEGWATLEHDPGRAQISHDPQDFGAFRTMGLRNIADTAPYMHNGALETLDDVVRLYNEGGGPASGKSPLIQPLGLTAQEAADLVAFLQSALEGKKRTNVVK